VKCACCGEERDPATVASLHCRDDIKVCRACVGWLRQQTHAIDSTPILPVRDMAEAIAFYERAGFHVEEYEGGGYAFVHRDDESAFDLDLVEPPDELGANHAGCYLIAPDVDDWHTALSAAGLPVTAVEDMPWGMHEFSLSDPSGNHVRIGRSTSR
jgi:catechol 2,3-dioxygenase-like lactoylglutathione lyase family enzyme